MLHVQSEPGSGWNLLDSWDLLWVAWASRTLSLHWDVPQCSGGTSQLIRHELSSLPSSFPGIELGGQRQGHMLGQAWSPGTVRTEGAECSAWKSLFAGVCWGWRVGPHLQPSLEEALEMPVGFCFLWLPMDRIGEVTCQLLWAAKERGKTAELRLHPPPAPPHPSLLCCLQGAAQAYLCELESFYQPRNRVVCLESQVLVTINTLLG